MSDLQHLRVNLANSLTASEVTSYDFAVDASVDPNCVKRFLNGGKPHARTVKQITDAMRRRKWMNTPDEQSLWIPGEIFSVKKPLFSKAEQRLLTAIIYGANVDQETKDSLLDRILSL